MTQNGTARGTVIRWDDVPRVGPIQAPDLPGGRVGEVDWTGPGEEGLPYRATRAVSRQDLQATLGG